MNNSLLDQSTALVNVASALDIAVRSGRFMSAEHAKSVWMKFLRENGFDAPREQKKVEHKEEAK